jgi:hypothetical protein
VAFVSKKHTDAAQNSKQPFCFVHLTVARKVLFVSAMHRALATTLFLMATCGLMPAVTLQQLSLDEMTQKSTSIVYGKVLDSYGAQHGSMIYTHYRVQVLQNWKGTGAGVVEVMLPGGTANGLRQAFAGVPALASGKAYLMFLWAGSTGAPQLIGLNQGLFDVAPDTSGALIASRPMSPEQVLDATGKPVQDQPVRLGFQEMNVRVKASISQGRQTKVQ